MQKDYLESRSSSILMPGTVIGMEQFLHDKPWDFDLSCQQDGIVAKYSHAAFELQKTSNVQSCSHIFNRIIRHRLYDLIYQRKNDRFFFKDNMETTINNYELIDTDYFIDFQCGNANEINNVFRGNLEEMSKRGAKNELHNEIHDAEDQTSLKKERVKSPKKE